MNCSKWLSVIVLTFACIGVATAFAEDKKSEPTKPAPTKPAEEKKPAASAAPAGGAEMMAEYAKLSVPGPQHAAMKPLLGSWNAASKFWMDPSAPPSESKAVTERKWVMGERFIQEEYKGDNMGSPFSGIGYMGYDNTKKKYVSIWMDSMSTGVMTSLGDADQSGKTFTFTGESDDTMTGKPQKTKTVLKIIDDTKHIMEMFMVDPSGKEFKNLEIVFTKK